MISTHDLGLADWLAAEIAVIAPSGTILCSNRKWHETAIVGGLAPRPQGWNYIAECERAARRGCAEALPIRDGLLRVLRGETARFIATYSCPFNGLHHWFQLSVTATEFEGQRHAEARHVDVSAMQVDALTGLPNRAMFDAQLDYALTLARERGCQTGIVIVDMNNLKTINDRHGHRAGDDAIKALAAELKAKAGPDCVVARIGGDEFGVVLPVGMDSLFGPRVLSHFRGGLSSAIAHGGGTMPIAASVGVALYPEDATTAAALYKAADRSMYAQKRGS